MEIIKEEPITNEKAYQILAKQKQLSYRAERTKKYLEKIGFIKNSDEILKQLVDLGIELEKAIMIVNTMPKTNDEVRAILEKDYTPEIGKKVLEIMKKALSSEK